VKRPYFVELFALANVILIAILAGAGGGRPSLLWLVGLFLTLMLQTLAGIGIRALIAFVRGRRGYLRRIRRRAWILETLRLVFATAVIFWVYGWIKLLIPILHPRLFDQELWDLDQTLFFGLAPTLFFLDVFGSHAFLRIIDWSYAHIFLASTVIAAAYFFSEPSRRIRLAFTNGNALLWIAGVWMYVLIPSLGPAYRFPDIWLAHGDSLKRTQAIQGMLMRNYNDVLRAAHGQPHGPLNAMFGIAAFPSLHVAFQAFVFFWMRRLWTSGEVLFAIFTAAIFLGSMITGWHYLVDGIAGLLLAALCWWAFWRRARMPRFLELFQRPWQP
jgi:PAP2 superfamily